ncbi:hypothetical protein [Leuconostoc lactis]|uniref:hypothetical protein n=1 Tax=Leuconostoc lactis TaxID=1246 RepID=UPI0021A788EA|nr:hypothetical protein [Leuconostoc lactis]MCT3115122.1 hypothetical protein [Leuconostoc lactis]
MTDYDYHRPKFKKQGHPIRNFFIVLAGLVVISLGVFLYITYSTSQITSTRIQTQTQSSKTIDETIDSTTGSTASQSSSTQHSAASSSSQVTQSSSASSSQNDSIKESAQLKGKPISEAIAWAKAHGRYYSWSITSGGNNAIVTAVTDDGRNINFVASAP